VTLSVSHRPRHDDYDQGAAALTNTTMCKYEIFDCVVCGERLKTGGPCPDERKISDTGMLYKISRPTTGHAATTDYTFSYHLECAEMEGFMDRPLSWINDKYRHVAEEIFLDHVLDKNEKTVPAVLTDESGNLVHAPWRVREWTWVRWMALRTRARS
jgi:hypothetical protein